MNRREFLKNLEFKIGGPILAVASCDKNPVSSGDNVIKKYQNYDLFGNLGMGSGVYYNIILPTTTTSINKVSVRKDNNFEWEKWDDWNLNVSEHTLYILDYTLKIGNWDYWINVKAWELIMQKGGLHKKILH